MCMDSIVNAIQTPKKYLNVPLFININTADCSAGAAYLRLTTGSKMSLISNIR